MVVFKKSTAAIASALLFVLALAPAGQQAFAAAESPDLLEGLEMCGGETLGSRTPERLAEATTAAYVSIRADYVGLAGVLGFQVRLKATVAPEVSVVRPVSLVRLTRSRAPPLS